MSFSNFRGRDIDGIVLLDKTSGFSSNSLLKKVKRLFCANKAGHAGTLDPLATGMLPICLGEATKFSQNLLDSDKRYRVTALLGQRTNTADSEGQVVSTRPVSINQNKLEVALNHFRGESKQIPPMFSALKYQGKPLYKYARKGIVVPRLARSIYIYKIDICHWDFTQLELEIHCSKGTYIRTVIDDLGEYLGCGAHVTVLRRLSVSSYATEHMLTFSTLQTIASSAPGRTKSLERLDALLLPIDSAMANIPALSLSSDVTTQIEFGKTVTITSLIQTGFVRLIEEKIGRFFGIGEICIPGKLTPRRLVAKQRA